MSTKQAVRIKNFSNVFEEYVATAVAITPGMLIEVTSTGLVQAHSTAGGHAVPMFADKDVSQGKTIDTAYAVSARIPECWIAGKGDIVNTLLANGETAVIGSKLVSDGAGRLKVFTADDSSAIVTEESIVGIALEAVDMSDSSGADPSPRIEVRIGK